MGGGFFESLLGALHSGHSPSCGASLLEKTLGGSRDQNVRSGGERD